MLLILFWISFLMFNFSYLFTILFLVFFIFFMFLCYMSSLMYLKYLIILVYISGVVVFIMYISCMCWYLEQSYSKLFLLLILFNYYFLDLGLYTKFSDMGQSLWMYLYFSFLFNSLVTSYSLNLFKVGGSLRF